MKRIYEQTKIVERLLFKQKIDATKKYRKMKYLTECVVESGILLLNTLTYELLFFTNEEMAWFSNPDINNDIVRFLIEEYFLVPEEFDDKKLASQVIDTRLQVQNLYCPVSLNHFVILPTTGCNARCFYCFEQGAKISNMTEKTAHDVADFIERKGSNNISISWFGGEPLCNIKAIDIISRDLIAKNIKFHSAMVSNGYLLDEVAVKKAIDLWNLKKIQITLDGTEDVYNKVKNYVYKDVCSPFKKVLNNIENALNANIEIGIRLNMDEHNFEDLFDLAKMLVTRFNMYENCHIYVVRLFEDTSTKIKNRELKDRHKLIEASVKLQDFINKNMPDVDIDNLPKSFGKPNTCMACSDSAVMIVPDGHLGKCEHFIDSDFFGSIYSDEIDIAKIQKYKERKTISENCDDCELRSLCIALKCCTGVPDHCDKFDKIAIKNRLDSKLINIYKAFIKAEKANKR